jgi:hypothetical protein
VVEQELPRLFGCSRYRSGIRQLWQVVTADAGCHVNVGEIEVLENSTPAVDRAWRN